MINILQDNPNVLGILLVGSRSLGKKSSDYDYEVIISDEYYKLKDLDELWIDNGDEEYLFISETDFSKKILTSIDVEKWRYQYAKIIFERNNYCHNILPLIQSMDYQEWKDRILLGYFELGLLLNKLGKENIIKNSVSDYYSFAFYQYGYLKLIFLLNYKIPPLPYYLDFEISKDRQISNYFKEWENNEVNRFEMFNLVNDLIKEKLGEKYIYNFHEITAEVNTEKFRSVREKYSWL